MNFKKFLSLFLCLTMLIPAFPVSALPRLVSVIEPAFETEHIYVNTAELYSKKASVSITATSQANGAFLLPPQIDLTVDEDVSESYGFSDSVEGGVSVLDALIKLHEIKYGDSFTTATAGNYFAESGGYISKLFGIETSACGFVLNGGYPNDGTESPWGGYNGTTVLNQALCDGDVVEFFMYQDLNNWSDELSWFNYKGNAVTEVLTAPESQLKLTLNSSSYMMAYTHLNAQSIHAVGSPVFGAQVVFVDISDGTFSSIENAITDTNGAVTIMTPKEEGVYYITAYIPEETAGEPLIMSLTKLTVDNDAPEDDPCALSFLSVASFDSNPNALTMTPAFKSDIYEYSVPAVEFPFMDIGVFRSVYVKAESSNENAVVTAECNGISVPVDDASNWKMLNGALTGGKNNILTVTVAESSDEGATTKVYIVKVPMKPQNNTPPSAVKESDTSEIYPGEVLNLDLSEIFTDPDEVDTVSYKVSINGNTPVEAEKAYRFTTTDEGTHTLVFTANDGASDSGEFTLTVNCGMSKLTKISVPSDASLYVGQKTGKHFVSFTESLPTHKLENIADSTVTYYFNLEDNSTYNYRISGENYITYGGTFKKTSDFSLDITKEMLTEEGKTKKTVDRNLSSNSGYNTGDIYLNINPQGHLKLKTGDEFQIVSLRNWQAVNNITANYFIEPDYHFTVLDESGKACNDVVTIDKNGKLKANTKGTAIVVVTYDAMNLDFGSGKVFYSAIWQENTGVFIVTVDDENSGISVNSKLNEGKNSSEIKLSGDSLDAEHDVIYFIGDKGEYTFTPTGENLSVSVANPVIGDNLIFNGFVKVTPNVDNSYTVPLTQGRNIVKISNDKGAEYQVITAKKINVTVNAGEEVNVGDELNIVIDTVFHPANKLAGVYNMSANAVYTKVDGYDGKIVGGLSGQYKFASDSSSQTVSKVLKEKDVWGQISYVEDTSLTVPADYDKDTFTLSGGCIYVSGWGDSYGNHRAITYENGKGANFNADAKCAYLGLLPDITIPIVMTSSPLSDITLDTQNVKTSYFAGDSFDRTNLLVSAHFEDGKIQTVSNYTISPEILTAGTESVTINYKGKTAVIPIDVTEPSVTSIEVAASPAKTVYTEGEIFDPTGMKINAVFDNGKKEETVDYSYSPLRTLKTQDTEIVIAYQPVKSLSASVPITVKQKPAADPDTPQTNDISVYVSVYGDTKHDDSTKHTMKDGNLTRWLKSTKITLPKGSHVIDALTKALSIAGIPYTNEDGNYISSVKGLSEFDNGEYSGWMYTVNGEYPDLGVDERKVKNGDSIILHYTDDYTVEQDSPVSTPSGNGGVGYTAELSSELDYKDVIKDTAKVIKTSVESPTVSSTGGEWSVIGLARHGESLTSNVFTTYYTNASKYVKDKNGVLSSNKYTEYSRVVIALCAIAKNPTDVSGFNLIAPLLDYDSVIKQGLNGPVWALIALDASGYKDDGIRQQYIDLILSREIDGGGWALNKAQTTPDVDITAMALTALSDYTENEKVQKAVDRGIVYLSKVQKSDGGFGNYSESTSQVLTAISTLGISYNDARFIKSGNTLVDNLLSFYIDGKGFKHSKSNKTENLMATEQSFYALVSAKRLEDKQTSLFDMSDVKRDFDVNKKTGLENKNPAVVPSSIKYTGKTFSDIKNHKYKTQIENLSERGIINGMTDSIFCPDSTMTRAEFATIVVRALGLEAKGKDAFSDVKKTDWYYSFVATAFSFGIVKGVSETSFNPGGTITRQEALVMLERAARLCGLEGKTAGLSKYSDSKEVASWAKSSAEFCEYYGIILTDGKIAPKEAVTRSEIAAMLYNMLGKAKLI